MGHWSKCLNHAPSTSRKVGCSRTDSVHPQDFTLIKVRGEAIPQWKRSMSLRPSALIRTYIKLCILLQILVLPSLVAAFVVDTVDFATPPCPVPCNCTTPHGEGIWVTLNCSEALTGEEAASLLLDELLEYYQVREGNFSRVNEGVNVIGILDLSHNDLETCMGPILFSEQEDNVMTQASFPVSEQTQRSIAVRVLNLSFNRISNVTALDLSYFSGLEELDVSHNNISELELDAFVNVQTLTHLNLSHNNISKLSHLAFQDLINLNTLDLSYNKFQTGDFDVLLRGLSSLKYLYLNNNSLRSIAFPSMPNLVHLNVANNDITSVAPGALDGLLALNSLDLRDNQLTELQPDSLAGLGNLQVLSLDRNKLGSLSHSQGAVFSNLSSLTHLSLASMPSLTNASYEVLEGLHSLVYLNLSHNPGLSLLSPQFLVPCPALIIVDLSHCGLTLLSPITFQSLTHLKRVVLQDNPFNCSCINAWLVQESWSHHSVFKDTSGLQCHAEDGQVLPMEQADVQCGEVAIHNMTDTVSVKLGSQIILRCQHHSDSPSVVTWTTPRGRQFHQHHIHDTASDHLTDPQQVEPGSSFHQGHSWHHSSVYHSELESWPERVSLLSDGSLYIDYMLRTDTGQYQCTVSNTHYNHTAVVGVYINSGINKDVQLFAIIVGTACALTFFALNVVYVIITWIARRLVNKRRREIIRQMLEGLNDYKSGQMTRIHENYTHQLSRVRNQYHVQRDKLNKNYTGQVSKMKRGCTHQVERVRENYHTRLCQLREYSSSQVQQIRDRANNQIVRIRDYGSSHLDRLRETYKLQQMHVLKLLDTMNLDNCRHVVETECMRTESMMFNIDILGDLDVRMDSPLSDSEYNTAASSPVESVTDSSVLGTESHMLPDTPQLEDSELTDPLDHQILVEMKTHHKLDNGLEVEGSRMWDYDDFLENPSNENSTYLLNMHNSEAEVNEMEEELSGLPEPPMNDIPASMFTPSRGRFKPSLSQEDSLSEDSPGTEYATPDASPVKRCPHKSEEAPPDEDRDSSNQRAANLKQCPETIL